MNYFSFKNLISVRLSAAIMRLKALSTLMGRSFVGYDACNIWNWNHMRNHAIFSRKRFCTQISLRHAVQSSNTFLACLRPATPDLKKSKNKEWWKDNSTSHWSIPFIDLAIVSRMPFQQPIHPCYTTLGSIVSVLLCGSIRLRKSVRIDGEVFSVQFFFVGSIEVRVSKMVTTLVHIRTSLKRGIDTNLDCSCRWPG
jgi:hypothetical protein